MEIEVAQQNNTSFVGKQITSFFGIILLSSITFPLEMIRTRIQTAPQLIRQRKILQPYKGVFDCVRKVKAAQGKRAFWKGNFANVLRMIPNETFNYFTKQSIQIWAKRHYHLKNNNIALNFISGSVGAIFTLIFTYPIDYARSRLSNDISGKSSIRSVLAHTYHKQGLKGIYRGTINFFISSALFRALYFGIFDTIKNIDPTNFSYKIYGSYIGSLIAIYSVYPFDTIRKRMMMTSGQNYKYKGFLDCSSFIFKKQGLRAFFKGWQLSLGQGLGAAGSLVFFDRIGSDIKRKNQL